MAAESGWNRHTATRNRNAVAVRYVESITYVNIRHVRSGRPTDANGCWRDKGKTCLRDGKSCTSGGGPASRRTPAEVAKRRSGLATPLSARDLQSK